MISIETRLMGKDRLQRELETYEEGSLNRESLEQVLRYCYFYQDLRMRSTVKAILLENKPEICLEIGSRTWYAWLHKNEYMPEQLTCVNLSLRELSMGKKINDHFKYEIKFVQGDAHNLLFEPDHFNLIFGRAILHHLELSAALAEVQRVLSPDGMIIFFEPLNINPAYKVYRYFHPNQRTKDERAFSISNLNLIKSTFNVKITYYNITSIPLGYIAKLFYKNIENPISKFAAKLDYYLCKVKYLQWLSSKCLIVGRKH